MDHYVDIALISDPDFTQRQLMEAVFAKIHRRLHERGQGQAYVSLPRAEKIETGDLLRLHGPAPVLEAVTEGNWMGGMSGFVSATPVKPVPAAHQWLSVRRYQPHATKAKLRRHVRDERLTEEQAQQKLNERHKRPTRLPFVNLRSRSNDHGAPYRVYVEQKQTGQPFPGEPEPANSLGFAPGGVVLPFF